MSSYVVRPDGKHICEWGLIAVNTALYAASVFRPVCFYITDENVFQGGPEPFAETCAAVSLLLGLLLYRTIRDFHISNKQETWLPILASIMILGGLVLDDFVGYIPQTVSFLTIAIVVSCAVYYDWLHLHFVREHEQVLLDGQRVQLALGRIKPHFLYNALGTIEALCYTDPQLAGLATNRFSEYLRGNMDAIDQVNAIPFIRELEHTKLYLEIEQLRFGASLTVRYDIACTDFAVPALTLELLAENAVRHGSSKNERGIGTVTIATREARDRYEISVTDDGPGFDTTRTQEGGEGHVGLRNVRERLLSVREAAWKSTRRPGRARLRRSSYRKLDEKEGLGKCLYMP